MAHVPRFETALDRTPSPPGERLVSPLIRFARLEAAGGIVLLIVAVIAMFWANSGLRELYHEVFESYISLQLWGDREGSSIIGGLPVQLSVKHWIDDALMPLFFLMVGLEIKREVLSGELSTWKQASLPVAGAIGGMIVPALMYVGINLYAQQQSMELASIRGWGVPVATDIAFALGVLALLGKRIPLPLRVFLTSLAIADDIGALLVIAFFYTEKLSFDWMMYAAIVFALAAGISALKVRRPLPYFLLGGVLVVCVYQSGIHATIAGVILATVIPVTSRVDVPAFLDSTRNMLDKIEKNEQKHPERELSMYQIAAARAVSVNAVAIRPPLHRLEQGLQPWVAFLIIPIFALANAGVDLQGHAADVALSPIAIGVAAGLVLGKPIGIVLACWLFVKLGISSLPRGVNWLQILGVGFLAGIGFTMSMFITNLAFREDALALDSAKVGILAASAVAAVAGLGILVVSTKRPREGENGRDTGFEPGK